MTDRLELRGLRLLAVVGALPEERERPQPVELDLDVELDLAPAGRSDDLARTLDYGRVCEDVAGVVASGRPQLLEALASSVADVVLADERVTAVTVTVRKLRPPVAVDLASAGVRVHRSR